MSLNVFPTLQGIKWPVTVSPFWNVDVATMVTGRKVTSTYQQYPLYKFKVSFEFLTAADFNTLLGFFNGQGGNLIPFWFDAGLGQNSVNGQVIGTGDGSNKTFTLLRSYGGVTEPVAAYSSTPVFTVNGTPESATFNNPTDGPATVTAAVAPATGATVRWTGGFYMQCYFSKGAYDIEQFASQLYTMKTLDMETFW